MKHLAVVLVFILAMAGSAMAAPPVQLIGSHPDQAVLKNIVSKQILENPRYKNKQFRRVRTEVVVRGQEKYLLTYLEHQNEYLFETSIVTLNQASNVIQRVEINVNAVRIGQIKTGSIINPRLQCPDMVYATPCDDIPTAVDGVQDACKVATTNGYTCKTLIGDKATTIAYKSYLTNCPNLKALGNIGHGNTECILLADGPLCYPWFDSLADNNKGKVLYFNSCNVHNPSLEPAIMRAGTRTYIGGNIGLEIGPSEDVFKCFWQKTLEAGAMPAMRKTLSKCEQDYYPVSGAHGISGNTGSFRRLHLPTPH